MKWSKPVRKRSGNVRNWSNMVGKWSIMVRKCQEMTKKLFKMVRKWSGEKPGHYQEMFKKCQEMLRVGNFRKWSENIKKWSKIIRILSKIEKQTKQRRKFILYTSSLSAEGAKAGSKKKETLNHPPHFYGSIFFCVLFFSFCSNLSIWPGRQVVPYESRCYTPIFDGLVKFKFNADQKRALEYVVFAMNGSKHIKISCRNQGRQS